MRRMISFLLLAATAASPLVAQTWNGQDQRPQRNDRGDRGDQRRDDRGNRADAPRPPVAAVQGQQGQRQYGQRPDDRGGPQRDAGRGGPDQRGSDWRGSDQRGQDWRNEARRDDRGPGQRDWRDDGRGNRPGYAGGPNGGRPGDWRGDRQGVRDDRGQGWNDGRGGWNNQWRNDRRYDWQGYRSGNRALYRAPRYYGPRGYEYSRWSRGYRVQPYFYGQNYWINDPYRYRLPPAYGSYRWVRYYDDVALVDIRSGLIEDIIYSFFYR